MFLFDNIICCAFLEHIDRQTDMGVTPIIIADILGWSTQGHGLDAQ